jgi:sugar/nucleoside kinase (ribokinase family)
MADTRFDVVGIGNAIVDVLGHAEDTFLVEHGLAKGSMALIDAERAERLYSAVQPVTQCSGGSAANSIAVLASLGGRGAFVGKVAKDVLGGVFSNDVAAIGVAFDTPPLADGTGTGRSFILVTPDAERTMQTYLGAAASLTPTDVDDTAIAAAEVTYLEGYLWDRPAAKEALLKAARTAHAAGRMVALSLSDRFCVARHHQEFLALVRDHVDILFANEDEAKALYATESLEDAVASARSYCAVTAVTRGCKGSLVATADQIHEVPADIPDGVVDTTGAGDAYAGGFLFGFANGEALPRCAHIGGIAAAEVISHFGARPEASLRDLVKKRAG